MQEWEDGRGQADYPLVKIFQGVADHEDHGALRRWQKAGMCPSAPKSLFSV